MTVTKKKVSKKKAAVKRAAPDQSQRQERVSHEQETWDNIDIHKDLPNIVGNVGPLPELDAREGMAQRWIRSKVNGEDDHANLSKAFNQHWRRRSPDTIPRGVSAPTIYVEGIGEAIGLSGMILMERPIEIHNAYKAKVQDRTQTQKRAVDESLFNIPAEGGFGAVGTQNKSEVKVTRALPVDD